MPPATDPPTGRRSSTRPDGSSRWRADRRAPFAQPPPSHWRAHWCCVRRQGGIIVDLGKLGRQAEELLASQKAQDALHSEKAEQVSDEALEKAGHIASRLTGGTYDDRIEDLKRQADKRIGDE
ncbi:antitoxin [Rathayibacter sp. VKM Ac-2878]|nr:antitoxin [Rathayibacter sp. VKM Ac-2879]MBF4502996.1 antitoxin [Rathayibacter sp. VKM Ac-2878]